MRHGGGAGLAGGKAFGSGFVTSHEAKGFGEGGRAAAEFDERGDDGEVEGAGVDLTDVFPDVGDAEVGGEAFFELGDFGGVAIEEGKLVELGADRAFEPAHAVAGDEVFEATEGVDELFPEHGEAFAIGGGLGRDVVGARGDDKVSVLGGKLGETGEGGDGFVAHEEEGAVDLQLLDVLGEVARGHSFVKLLVAGEVVEFFDPCFDVVAGDALAGVDGGEVDLVFDGFVSSEGFVGDVETEVFLGAGDGKPEFAFEEDAAFGGPDIFEGGRGVAFSEDVWNHLRAEFGQDLQD